MLMWCGPQVLNHINQPEDHPATPAPGKYRKNPGKAFEFEEKRAFNNLV